MLSPIRESDERGGLINSLALLLQKQILRGAKALAHLETVAAYS